MKVVTENKKISMNKNMKRSKGMPLGAMLAAMLLVSMAVVPAVSAAGTSNLSDPATVKALFDKLNKAGDNASKIFAKLSPQDQAAVIEYFKVKKITTTNEENVSMFSITCNSPRVVVSGLNALGQKRWDYFQQIDRCYDGSTLTEVTRTRGGQVYGAFWQFIGHTSDTQSGGVGQSSYRSWTQGKFQLCFPGVGCVEEDDPWIDMIVYGNGDSWYNYGGGIKTFP